MKLLPELARKRNLLGNDVHLRLFRSAKAACLPFWWHGPTPSDARIFNNGTLCLVDTGEQLLGVTAFHVYPEYLDRLALGSPFVCQFGSATVSPEKLLIDKNKKMDLATFDLSSVFGELHGCVAHRPLTWPPERPTARDLVIYGGFPGSLRHSDLVNANFSLDTVTGLISDVTPQRLVIEVDYERLHDVDGPSDEVTSSDPRGTSGGPVFRVIPISDGYNIEIVGFVYEWFESAQCIFARHSGVIQADGQIQP